MEKRIGLASDFVLYGYVLQGMTTLFDWWSVFSWISLGFGLIALGLSIKGAMLAKKEENSTITVI